MTDVAREAGAVACGCVRARAGRGARVGGGGRKAGAALRLQVKSDPLFELLRAVAGLGRAGLP